MLIPIMDVYPSPKNTFDVFLSADGDAIAKEASDACEKIYDTHGAAAFNACRAKYIQTHGKKKGLDPNAIAGAITAGATIIGAFSKTDVERQLKAKCGRRPMRAKNRGQWNSCKDKFYADQQQSGMPAPKGGGSPDDQYPMYQQPKKGLSTGAIVGIVGAVALVGVLAYVGLRKVGSRKVNR